MKKSHRHSGKLTQAIFQATEREEERLKEEEKRRLNVSGVLRILGVSRSGDNAFRKHTPSVGQVKKEQRMAEIRTILPGHWGRRWKRNGYWRPWRRRKSRGM